MFSTLVSLYTEIINRLSGGDATARAFVTLWLLTGLSYTARNIPKRIWSFIKTHSVISITITKDKDARTAALFHQLQELLLKENKFTVRNRSVAMSEEDRNLPGFARGGHLIFLRGRLLWLFKEKENQTGSNRIIETLTIRSLGRNPDFFQQLIDDASDSTSTRYFWGMEWVYAGNPWGRRCVIQPSPAFFLDPDVKSVIDKEVLFFRDNRQWYLDRNLPYKLTIVLYGPPGTGKSSIIRYISDLLNSDIYEMNLENMPSSSLLKAMTSFRKNVTAVVAVEDFENSARKRTFIQKENEADDEFDIRMAENTPRIACLLNVLQGIAPLDNVITVMTTNHIEKVDPAVIRSGRTDVLLEVGPLGLQAVKQHFEFCYGQQLPEDIVAISPIKACDMAELFRQHRFDAQGYLTELRQNYAPESKPVLLCVSNQ